LRVAFYAPLVPASDPGSTGDTVQARAVLAALAERGCEVCVVSEFRARGFWLRPHRLRRLPGALVTGYRVARAFHPDVWLTFGTERDAPDALGPLLSRLLNVPYLVYKAPAKTLKVRAWPGGWRAILGRLPGHLLNEAALRAARQVVVNKPRDFTAYQCRRKLAGKVSLLLPSVCTETFKPDPAARLEVRRRLGLARDTALILSASRLWDRHGKKARSVAFLIEQVAALAAEGRDLRLLVVGEGRDRARLEALAAECGAPVVFAGAVEHGEMARYYSAANIFAFPGLGEAIGIVYLEAQACGLPVVAFRGEGVASVVRDGETSLLTQPLDAVAFRQILRRLLDSEEERQRLGQAGREFVRRQHDRSVWSYRLCEVVEAVARGSKPETDGVVGAGSTRGS
jgi:glycosyltransferase involved in cell wall biosynthesis